MMLLTFTTSCALEVSREDKEKCESKALLFLLCVTLGAPHASASIIGTTGFVGNGGAEPLDTT